MTGDQFVYLAVGMLIGVIFMITANILRGNPRVDELQREIQSFCLVELDQIDRISDLEKEVGTLRRVNAQQAITMREVMEENGLSPKVYEEVTNRTS